MSGNPKRVIFLDFDGVLNSMASFHMEGRKSRKQRKGKEVKETLCHVACSNFQYILDQTPNCWIVISSTWRELHTLEELKEILTSYGIDASRVIGITPSILHHHNYGRPGQVRGEEIQAWLDENPEFQRFCIVDDNFIGHGFEEKHKEKPCMVITGWMFGLTMDQAMSAIAILGGHANGEGLVW